VPQVLAIVTRINHLVRRTFTFDLFRAVFDPFVEVQRLFGPLGSLWWRRSRFRLRCERVDIRETHKRVVVLLAHVVEGFSTNVALTHAHRHLVARQAPVIVCATAILVIIISRLLIVAVVVDVVGQVKRDGPRARVPAQARETVIAPGLLTDCAESLYTPRLLLRNLTLTLDLVGNLEQILFLELQEFCLLILRLPLVHFLLRVL